MSNLQDLENIYYTYEEDPAFNHLRENHRNFVPGIGPLQAPLMLIGEAPGKMENVKLQPFVGKAGRNLVDILTEVGISTEEVFRTNTVKYWPLPQQDGSYTPTEQEIVDSKEYLLKEIEIVDPVVVGLCGKVAINSIFPDIKAVAEKQGELLQGKFVPLYHPALVSYQPWMKDRIREGYLKLKAYLDAKAAA